MDYKALSLKAKSRLAQYGQTVTLRFRALGGGTYNTSSSTSNPVSSSVSRKGLLVDAPQNRVGPQYGTNLQNGTLIQATDRWLYMDANGPSPRLQDRVVVGKVEYSIIDIQEINPAGIAVLYLLVLRA